MSRIAAPEQVSRHPMGDVPPGHRFSLYLPLWNASWGIDDAAKRAALDKCCSLGDAAPLLTALRTRQQAQADAVPAAQRLVIDATATAPFATGLGNEHPVENGFAFLSPYGLPYLAGSGVKGVLRRAMEELAHEGADGIDQPLVDALFGPEDRGADGSGPPLPDSLRRRGALSFWDVYPEPEGKQGTPGRLCVEVMTPHQGEYYQGRQSPHEAGQPIPIFILALPPQSKLRFIVTHEPAFMPDGLRGVDWRVALDAAFARAFYWLGFGAKTAVGYGAMEPDRATKAAKAARQEEAKQRLKEAEAERLHQGKLKEAKSEAERAVIEYLHRRPDKSQPDLAALLVALRRGEWSGELKSAIAAHVKSEMQHARRWKEKTEKKNPLKDHDHQDTLLVMKCLAGQ